VKETRELRGETKGCSSGCEQAGSTNLRPSSWLSQHVSVLSLKLVEPARERSLPEAGWAGPRRRSSPCRNHPTAKQQTRWGSHILPGLQWWCARQ